MLNCQLPETCPAVEELFELELLPPQPASNKSTAHRQISDAPRCGDKNLESIVLSLADASCPFIGKRVPDVRICVALKNSI